MEKEPLKIVLDSNILVSAFIFGGNPKEVVELILDGEIQSYISTEIIEEIRRACNTKFHVPILKYAAFERRIRKRFTIIYPGNRITKVRDKDDNKILEAATESECDYIITDDKDLLKLKKFRKIKIVTPKEFLEIIGKPSSR